MPNAVKLAPVVEDSVQYFRGGLYCSEAILKAFNDHYRLELPDQFLKIATGFGAGLGGSKCTCGALTGGTMVLSLLLGRTDPGEPEADVFQTVSELYADFKQQFVASCCKVLTRPVEWGSPEHHKYCEQFVRRVAETTDSILKSRAN